MVRFFQETLTEMRTKCIVILPRFSLKVVGGRIHAVGEEVELDISTAKWRAGRGQVRLIGEPYLADTGVRVEDPPASGRRWSSTQW